MFLERFELEFESPIMMKVKTSSIMQSLLICFTLFGWLMMLTPSYAMAELPKSNSESKVSNQIPVSPVEPQKQQVEVKEDPSKIVFNVESISTDNELSREDIDQLFLDYNQMLKAKQFDKALDQLNELTTANMTPALKDQHKKLKLLSMLQEKGEAPVSGLASEDNVSPYTAKQINRLYREAQSAYLSGDTGLAQDLLVQILYLDRRNVKARVFLEDGLQLRPGTYKIENVESKYWKLSEHQFYIGNYDEAIQSLTVLTVVEPEDAEVFERLGSNYYAAGDIKSAIASWKSAGFLYEKENKKSKSESLRKTIQKAEEVLAERDKEAKDRLARRAKEEESNKEVKKVDMKIINVFPTQERAFAFAQAYQKQNDVIPVVEENDDGKWAVKVPKAPEEKKGK